MKRLVSTTAVLLLMSPVAFAQTVTAPAESDPLALPAEGDTGGATMAPEAAVSETVIPGKPATEMAGIAPQDVTAEDLIGQPVYGPDEQKVGSISDIVFTSSGEVDAAVVKFGGFLGIGAHRVALPLDQFDITREPVPEAAYPEAGGDLTAADPATDPGAGQATDPLAQPPAEGPIRLRVAMTEEELEAMPEYEPVAPEGGEAAPAALPSQ